jgi:hypothetical protein
MGLLLGWLVALNAVDVSAQENGSLTGTLRDTTGAVLPGGTVEAASPALIERARSTITDATGQYRITELQPGTYAVTFTLAGFNTVKREGIELTSGFTATVNAELRVGDVAETVVVSGDSPIVDIQNVVQQRVITRDVMDAIPSSKNFASMAALIPGVFVFNNVAVGRSQDVGGSGGNSDQTLSIHGGRGGDQRVLVDGMPITLQEGLGGESHFMFPHANIEELNVDVGAHTAEAATGGIMFRVVPRSGGNQMSGYLYASYTNKTFLSNNLDQSLKDRGLLTGDQINYISDVNPALGGPIVKDRLWFYGGARSWRVMRLTSIFYNANPTGWTYVPDVGHGPVPYDTPTWDLTGRLTWQVSDKNKISTNLGYAARCECEKTLGPSGSTTIVYEASSKTQFPARLFQATWMSPITNRLLLEAGGSAMLSSSDDKPQAAAIAPPAVELSTGYNFRAATIPNRSSEWHNDMLRASVSYVIGSHNFKSGVTWNPAFTRRDVSNVGSYQVNLLSGVPSSVSYLATPYYDIVNERMFALFAQDQWTLTGLTLNLGLRFDSLNTSYPPEVLPANAWFPARSFAGANVLNWKDLNPRLGAAYDLFGNGRTALKISLSRYVGGDNLQNTRGIEPADSATGTLTRAWVDSNGDFIPLGNPLNPLPNGELTGPSPNMNWGKPVVTTRFDPGWANGWNRRDYNWETSAGIQQELMSGVSLNASYFRRWYGNFPVINNTALAPSDYSPYCITGPLNSRLPGGGGQQICGLFDLQPAYVGLVNNVETLASNFGIQFEHWQGVDLTINARMRTGIILQGGVDTGKTVTDNCDVAGKISPPTLYLCHAEQPLLTQLKLAGSYTLPAQVQIAATLRSSSGIVPSGVAGGADFGVQANYVATNAVIRPSLGRNLSSGPNGTVTVNLVQPGVMTLPRVDELDVRFARTFTIGRVRLKGLLDLDNILNANPILTENYTYGATGTSWLVPQSIMLGRLLTFGTQLDF